MTLRRSLLWFVIGVVWVFAAFAIVYAHGGDFDGRKLIADHAKPRR